MICAGAADTPELAAEIAAKLEQVGQARDSVVWIERMLDRPELSQLLSHAAVFVCPSIYEPLGIVNLEAMACATAVVATATGGIPEVVEDGVTGYSSRSTRSAILAGAAGPGGVRRAGSPSA